MSKYIPAEKLIAEIEFAKSVYSNPNRVVHGIADAFRQDGRAAMCDDILKKIDSLQQEQRNPNLENEIKAYTETLYHEIFGNGQGTLDEFDWEDITQVIDDTARYFYVLNKNDE